MAECEDANLNPKTAAVQECVIAPMPPHTNLDPKTASVKECGIATVPPGAFTQRKDASFGLRTMLMCQWWPLLALHLQAEEFFQLRQKATKDQRTKSQDIKGGG
ncbi:hypothetical protein llap_10257 [Limosa lapponica baueri]|uniref:Uncharacterized protein n=1 Tax=Limosa lapponica baueri TaxID=1758121 RepID=A0A2I0U077_LIMLA|nr:hypothetical protein llap_10257 [Limosa lapponica baueri]